MDKETDIKYLSGLFDADGCLSYTFVKNKSGKSTFHINLILTQSEEFGKKLMDQLVQTYGGCITRKTNAPHILSWKLSEKSQLNKLIPRIVKHQIIKAKHWKWLFDVQNKVRGIGFSDEEAEALKSAINESRNDVGPLKPKNFPSRAWTSGFLDGDGHYRNRLVSRPNRNPYWDSRVQVEIDIKDRVAVDLLYKTHGGSIHTISTRPNLIRWTRNLGIKDKSFSLDFLALMAKHSKLKKHRIEMIIHSLRQRLTDSTPKGDVIV